MQFEIYLSNPADAYQFKEDVPDGVVIDMPEIIIKKGSGVEYGILFIVAVSANISSHFLIKWIKDKLSNCRSEITKIDRQTINFDKGQISQIINEKIKKESNQTQ